MKKQHLIVLGVLVAALIVLRLVRESREEQAVVELAEAGIVRLAPADLAPDAVARVEVRGPAGAEGEVPDPLVAERTDGGWVVTSAFGAPARGDDVDAFVKAAVGASGDVRGEGKASFATFGVDDEHAMRVALAASDGTPLLTLRLGQGGDDPDALFVRAGDDERVVHVRADLTRKLGLYGDQRSPATDAWVDKVALKLAADDLARVEVTRPDARWTFERAPKAVEEDSAEEASEDEPGEPETTAEAWTLEEPVLGWPLRQASLDSTVGRIGDIRVTSILDPGSAPECATEDGVARVAITTRDGGTHLVRVGPRLAGSDDVVVRVDGTPFCWSISKWTAQSLLPRAATIFEVPEAFPEPPAAEDFERLTLERPGDEPVKLRRGDEKTWELVSGDGVAESSRADRLISTLRMLRADDLVDAALVQPALLEPMATITARAAGRELVVELLGERAGPVAGRFVRVRGGAAAPEGFVAVVAATTADSLAPARADLVKAE